MPPAGFEPTIPTSERPQTHALDLAASGIGIGYSLLQLNTNCMEKSLFEKETVA